jgi:hypothetical protein
MWTVAALGAGLWFAGQTPPVPKPPAPKPTVTKPTVGFPATKATIGLPTTPTKPSPPSSPSPPPPPTTPTPEIARVDALARLVASEARLKGNIRPEVVQSFIVTVEDGIRALAGEAGSPEGMKLDAPELHGLVEDWVLQQTRNLPDGDQPRGKALLETLKKVTTRSLPASMLDQWLGLAAQPEPSAAAPAVSSLAQLQATSTSPALAIDAARIRLAADVGGSGGGNGVIDGQEWIELVVPVANRGDLPWFSASAQARSESPCLWVDGAPRRLPEMPVGGEPILLSVLAYVAGDCPSTASRTITVQVDDTHRGSTGPQLSIAIMPTPQVRIRLGAPKLDADVLGFSDGSAATVLTPDVRTEFSVDVFIDGKIVQVGQAFLVPEDLRRAFKRLEHDAALSLIGDERGVWRAADDLDIEMASNKRVVDVFRGSRASKRFVATGQPGRLWVAIDISYAFESSAAPVPASAPAPPPARPLPEVSEVLALLEKHLSLVPHPVEPAVVGAVRAASGVEVLVDRGGFAVAWEKLTALPVAEPRPPAPATGVRYSRRFYVALSTMPVQPEEALPPPPTPTPTPTPAVAAAPPPAPLPWIRLDVAAGAMIGAHGVVRDPQASFSIVPGVDVGVRAWFGRTAALVVGGNVSGGSYRRLGVLNDATVLETSAEVGGGYRLRLDAFELGPFATLGIARRVVGDDVIGDRTPILTPTVGAGLAASWAVTGPLDVFVEVGGRWGLNGPVLYSTRDGADFYLGPAARLRLGVAFEF